VRVDRLVERSIAVMLLCVCVCEVLRWVTVARYPSVSNYSCGPPGCGPDIVQILKGHLDSKFQIDLRSWVD
jgi:hypothetical protein